ncbi:MAG: FAD-dependent oxidoreductase [Verrucomicrobia bacterium]|nr:FAD-dependent oxidoreductase [Verrucomicrobiota bacterium]MCH8512794.1 FAD-dependent oxidoreductase [Kiritimatiellia bacterium]
MPSLKTDILIAGGGPAGVPCAVAAAREGAKVILVQDRPMLGGNASSEVRMHIVGADAFGGRELEVEAREGGLLEEFRLQQCVENPQRSATLLDLGLYNLVRNEPNITLLLNTTLVGAECDGKRIHRARAVRHGTEETFEIEAAAFVDCTGDGRLGLEAGAAFVQGREERERFGEQHAQARADKKTLGSSLLYQARQHLQPMPFAPPSWARKFTAEDLRLRLRIDEPSHEDGLEYGFWWAEWGGELDTIADNERIRDELLAILFGVWDFIKNSGRFPQSANWALDWFGWVPGKRESRRFLGRHVLTEADVLRASVHPDSIAYGGWPIDLHPPAGVDATDESPCRHIHVPNLYGIPLRCCMARDIDNLYFAGRNLSASHVAFASTRVMGTCAAVGQGLGTAVALAVRESLDPEALIAAAPRIQQRLLRQDAFLPGVAHNDPDDLAPRARIQADSERPGASSAEVCSGYTRSTHGPGGTAPDQTVPGLHRWMSQSLPATLALSWEEPVKARAIQIIFDTGLHRILTHSQSDKLTARMIWGRPQPETVRDYDVEIHMNNQWETVTQQRGNFQRRNFLPLDPDREFTRLRIHVLATQGLDHARICEVRVLS